jgi:hypothetical protein
VDFLNYGKPDDSWNYCAPVGRDGILRATYKLSEWLSTFFNWQKAQATVFLLTDLTPWIASHTVSFGRSPWLTLPYGGTEPLSCLTRITLSVDPLMTPRELAEKYAALRARVLVSKPRALSPKHLELAVFATEHPNLDRQAMQEWVGKFPEWKYPTLSKFSRDARTARRRLLHRNPVEALTAFSRLIKD